MNLVHNNNLQRVNNILISVLLPIQEEQAVPAARPLGLEALAQIATSMEGELQVETHQEDITSLVREKGSSSKKP